MTRQIRRTGRPRWRTLFAIMASILVAGSALAMTEIEPASAALGDPGQVSLQKSVAVDGAVGTPEDLGPGDSFTYSFLVG